MSLAELKGALDARVRASERFGDYWKAVISWNESSRYEPRRAEGTARDLVLAVGDTEEGVLTWIKKHW